MATTARRRLARDFKRLVEDPPDGISGAPVGNDIMRWNALICGPEETPFAEGTFKLTLEFSEEYPNKLPVVKFLSKMFHPNVFEVDGKVCLSNIFQVDNNSMYDVSAILVSIQALLGDPNPNRSANSLANKLFRKNQSEYLRRVKECVELSWSEEKNYI